VAAIPNSERGDILDITDPVTSENAKILSPHETMPFGPTAFPWQVDEIETSLW
jgi:hypothetical protein